MSDSLSLVLKRAVRAERARLAWSQTELVEALGWSQSRVASLEMGTRQLYAHELPEICAVFDITLDRLFAAADRQDRERLGL